ncbi:bacillithiol system redox-active protein YtxJ [Flavobacterium sp.]
MSLLNNLFGKSQPEESADKFWKILENSEQLEEIKKISFEKPVTIFKHSTRCSISRMAWNQFQKHYNISSENMEVYFLDLIEYRSISNGIADDFQVQHQSPQILVIKDGVCVFTTSHESIDAKDLEDYVVA